jgi:hypothetical protein
MIRCIHENREGIVLKFKRNTIKLIDSGGKAVCQAGRSQTAFSY